MSVAPHGGRLVDRVLGDAERGRRESELADLPKLTPHVDAVYDAEKIAIGAYSPLEGFMGGAEFDSVAEKGVLSSGLPWTIPIVLAPNPKSWGPVPSGLKSGDDVALLDRAGHFFALFHLEEKFRLDHQKFAKGAYGTTDTAHPNVADIVELGPEGWGGRVDLLRRLDYPHGAFELTPKETREAFARMGWKRVAAYQCRNPPHTAHEYLQRLTLDREDVDGLFIHPVVGRLKRGDYKPEVILRSYEALVSAYYPATRVLLAGFSITMRYAGPKAAVFLAIVRKNFGCGLYIVGRDQAGVGKFYDPYACHRIFDEVDVGVTPLRYEETFFCRRCGWMATTKTCAHPTTDRIATSQTRIREALAAREPLPTEVIRPEVAAILSGTEGVLSE
ncbi:MAG TPA: sulfate adenylyltransferase [Thermoplasmata archaeon]|nr:sulfate adenylyltransferase [Thermoplasmata archaeon]